MTHQFHATFHEWNDINTKLYNDCKSFLEELLAKLPNQRINLSEDNDICVSYDGGNHPEYDSDCYNRVESVYMKDGNILLDTADADEYTIKYLTANELYDVACAVEDEANGYYDEVED